MYKVNIKQLYQYTFVLPPTRNMPKEKALLKNEVLGQRGKRSHIIKNY